MGNAEMEATRHAGIDGSGKAAGKVKRRLVRYAKLRAAGMRSRMTPSPEMLAAIRERRPGAWDGYKPSKG